LYGVLAAAVNTAIGYGVLLVGVSMYTRSVSEVRPSIEKGRIGSGIGLVTGAVLVAHLASPSGTSWFDLAVRAIVVAVVGVLMSATGLLPGMPWLGRSPANPSTPPA
jgi:hypothetical protein